MSNLMQKNNIEKLFFQPTPHTEFHSVEITPEIAKRLLDNTDSKVQRKLKRNHVVWLSNTMKEKQFKQNNGDTIRQDIEGNIIDGQHRLAACIDANFTLKTIFVKGLETDIIKTINIGQKTRTFTDVLEINHRTNYKYCNVITASVKFIIRFQKSIFTAGGAGINKSNLSTETFLKWIDKNPEIIDFIGETMIIVANGDRLIKASVFCGLKWVLDKYNKTESDIFFQMLSDGIGLKKSSPIYTLRKKIFASKFGVNQKKYKIKQRELIFLILKTWNSYLDNKTITRFVMPKDMPKIKSIKKA